LVWIWLLGIIGLFICLYLLNQKRQEEETGLYYKLLGFSFLGAFFLSLNGWKIPLGFALCLLLVARVKRNKRIKQAAVMIGLLLFVFQIALTSAEKAWFERSQSVAISVDHWYEQELKQTWAALEDKFGLHNARLENFWVTYEANGKVNEFHLAVLQQENGKFVITDIQNDKPNKQLVVRQERTEGPWQQFERAIQADYFFEKLDGVDRASLKPEMEFPYYAFSAKGDGFTTYAIKDSEKYAIEEDRIVAITNEQLPVTGFWLRVRGLNDNGAMDANGQADFFFDYRFDPEIEPQ
jgi:hypothetical protein